MTMMTSAINLIKFIANDYIEFSHDKVQWQRDDYVKRCRQWLTDHNDALYSEIDEKDIVARLRKRAEIRRQIPTRRSVQEGQPDRLADLLEEAANEIAHLKTFVLLKNSDS